VALVSDKGEFVRTEPESSKQIDNSQWPIRCETGGEIFDDGTLIELVEDLQEENGLSLLKSDGGEPVFSPVVEHLDRTYVPVKLDRTFRQALRIPSSLTSYGSVESLKKNLLALTTRFTDLAEHPKQQLVSVILASWVADFLFAPLNVWLWSPSAVDGARLLELLHCLCRLPVLLSGASVADLRSLPDKLPATLLILRPASGRRMRGMASRVWVEGLLPHSLWAAHPTLRRKNLFVGCSARQAYSRPGDRNPSHSKQATAATARCQPPTGNCRTPS
jgi:hypothetical protein